MTRRDTIDDAARPEPFGRLPCRMVWAGRFSSLSMSEARVYIAIAAHVNGKAIEWSARPSMPTIASLAGVSERTAQRTLEKLRAAGLIGITAGGGRGKANVYTLETNPVTLDDTLSEVEKGVKSTRKGCQPRAKRVSNLPVKGVTMDDTRTEQQMQQSNRPGAQAPDAAAVRAAMEVKGITAPKAAAVARAIPGLSVAIVEDLAKRASSGRNPAGLLVTLLETEAAGMIAEAERRDAAAKRRAAEAAAKRQGEASHAATNKAEAAESNNLLASVSYMGLQVAKLAVLAEANGLQRKLWEGEDPRTFPGLKRAIVRWMRVRAESSGGGLA